MSQFNYRDRAHVPSEIDDELAELAESLSTLLLSVRDVAIGVKGIHPGGREALSALKVLQRAHTSLAPIRDFVDYSTMKGRIR